MERSDRIPEQLCFRCLVCPLLFLWKLSSGSIYWQENQLRSNEQRTHAWRMKILFLILSISGSDSIKVNFRARIFLRLSLGPETYGNNEVSVSDFKTRVSHSRKVSDLLFWTPTGKWFPFPRYILCNRPVRYRYSFWSTYNSQTRTDTMEYYGKFCKSSYLSLGEKSSFVNFDLLAYAGARKGKGRGETHALHTLPTQFSCLSDS